TAYMTAAFILASIAAFKLIKNKFRKDAEYHKKALKVTMTIGIVTALLTILAGDFSAKFLHNEQPEKLAAMEWHYETKTHADMVLFGTLDEENQEVKYSI